MSFAFVDPDTPFTAGVLTRRAIAWCIDVVLIGILVSVAWWLILTLSVLTLGLGFVFMAGLPVIGFLYHVLSVAGRHSATPGQRMLDITVRRERDLGPPDLLQALVFTVGLYITLASAFLLLAVVCFTPRKRALHDMAAGVVVVRKRALTDPSPLGNMGFGRPSR